MGDWRKPTDDMPADSGLTSYQRRVQEFADMVSNNIMRYAVDQAKLWEDQSFSGLLLAGAVVSCALMETAATCSAVLAINDSAEGKLRSKTILTDRFERAWNSAVASVPDVKALQAHMEADPKVAPDNGE